MRLSLGSHLLVGSWTVFLVKRDRCVVQARPTRVEGAGFTHQ